MVETVGRIVETSELELFMDDKITCNLQEKLVTLGYRLSRTISKKFMNKL